MHAVGTHYKIKDIFYWNIMNRLFFKLRRAAVRTKEEHICIITHILKQPIIFVTYLRKAGGMSYLRDGCFAVFLKAVDVDINQVAPQR